MLVAWIPVLLMSSLVPLGIQAAASPIPPVQYHCLSDEDRSRARLSAYGASQLNKREVEAFSLPQNHPLQR